MNPPIILSYKPLKRTGEINEAYADAIKNSGGVLQMLEKKEEIDTALENADGILLPGGTDINPALYGEKDEDGTQTSNNERDEFESYLIEKTMEKKLPILGICRGLQMLNVKSGGTLYQDTTRDKEQSIKHDFHADGPRSLIAHDVTLTDGSYIHKILGTDKVDVNSLHHQGIKDLGKGLVATGVAPDGLIEAVEMPSYPYLVAVQWHPEELTENPIWKKLFDDFIRVCSK